MTLTASNQEPGVAQASDLPAAAPAAAAAARMEQCYVLSPNEGACETSYCTLGEVKRSARLIPTSSRQYARVLLVAYPVNKSANVARRNGKALPDKVLRKWRLSSRAALIEMRVDQE